MCPKMRWEKGNGSSPWATESVMRQQQAGQVCPEHMEKPLVPRMPGLPWCELEKCPQPLYSRSCCGGTLTTGRFSGSQSIR